jgi:hypothetical protein
MRQLLTFSEKICLGLILSGFLLISLGVFLNSSSLNNVHVCPNPFDKGEMCTNDNFTHAEHWLNFLSSSIPVLLMVILLSALLSLRPIIPLKPIIGILLRNLVRSCAIINNSRAVHDRRIEYIFSCSGLAPRAP